MIRITVDGEIAQLSAKLFVTPDLWDTAAGKVSGKSIEAVQTNPLMEQIKSRIVHHYNRIMQEEDFATAEKVKNAFLGIGVMNRTLMKDYAEFNISFKEMVAIGTRERSTLTKYRVVYNHLSDFLSMKKNRKDIAYVEEAQTPMATKKKERQNRKLLEGLPVVEVVIEPQGIDLTKYKRIGEERTRTLEFEPGKLYVKEIIRPKYGLKDNTALPEEHQAGIVIADLPLLPIYKGLPGASLLAEILLQKYEYHVPFYRQVREFHHLGLKIPENTLHGWFKPACELLKPLYDELKAGIDNRLHPGR